MSHTADRIVNALRKNPALLVEVLDRLNALKRAGPWTPHPGVPGRWHRNASDTDGAVAVAHRGDPPGTGPGYMLRGDVGVGQRTDTVEMAVVLADRDLEAAGWVLLPQPDDKVRPL